MIQENKDHNPDPKLGPAIAALPVVNDPKSYEPAQDLIFTRNVRGQIVQGLAGSGIPSDPKALQVLMSTLKDMDSSALGQMRIKSEEKGQDLQAQHQALVREMLVNMSGMRPPERRTAGQEAAPPQLPDDVQTRDFVPGELQQGTVNKTFDEFTAQQGGVQLAASDAPD